MEYPIWQLTTFAGGFWVALIATIHVYVAQFAVGGGLFLAISEHLAYRTDNPHILAYTKQHSKFFLLLTMVFGAVTGVGIWVTVALLSPQATITLIHTFVFGWATEWICFLGEILALLCYFYGWNKLSRRDHLTMGWLYFLFGWLSLFLINGIIGFMLTPGDWMTTGNFWDGFFNPSFWPSLVFRTLLSVMIAGLFGFLTATRVADEKTREFLVKTCAAWTVLPFALFLLSGWWYLAALPEAQHALILEKSQRVGHFMQWFWVCAPLAMLGALALAVKLPRSVRFPLALVVLVLGLGMAGSFEFVRESGRKPYLIFGHTYSNSILAGDIEAINEKGMLASARWADASLLETDPAEAGRILFQLECSSCHSLGGPMNDLIQRTEKFTRTGLTAMLSGLGRINTYMPPFAGTVEEREVLADWLFTEVQAKVETDDAVELTELPDTEIPAFDPDQSEYVLTAWADKGFVFFTDADSRFILLPPGSDLKAQLVQRGDPPQLVTPDSLPGVTIEYALEPGYENPAQRSEFWANFQAAYNQAEPLPENIGTKGKGTSGTMETEGEGGVFCARAVPVVPYPDPAAGLGQFQPYPLVTVTAKDADGTVLGETKITAPASTEMGCRTCHGGEWKVDGRAGITPTTADDILATHDRMNKTNHVTRANDGHPVVCQECHGDPSLGLPGKDDLPNLSAAIHGAHAVYFTGRDSTACGLCHPTSEHGATRAVRGRHAYFTECADCHGPIEDHALSLLKFESERGVTKVDRIIAKLTPRAANSVDDIRPRQPWAQVPDCLTCHKEYRAPEFDGFNTWTETEAGVFRNRLDDMEVLACAACHNSPHAIWPATNPYNEDRDNLVPLQYTGQAGTLGTDGTCVCHTIQMEPTQSAHHDVWAN
ncbi:MAG: cytochrome ubiquinol oxidase subunit I [Proteobacteria bacterium]|nr:cytochrome ubiquinol oxidase subunit I [Pseudomonadota bacterium]